MPAVYMNAIGVVPNANAYQRQEQAQRFARGRQRSRVTDVAEWIGERELSYRICCVWFALLACAMALVPVKDYILGTYVTRKFDEVRDDPVARMPHGLHAVASSVHYFDVFARDSLRLLDATTRVHMERNDSRNKTLVEFLVYTSVSRSSLLATLPPALLATKISLMDNYYAPLCGPTWSTGAQLLFGHYFPSIQHEFCREYGAIFPHRRFFDSASSNSGGNRTNSPLASLGVIGLINMSEVDLRHFHSAEVVRALTRSVLSGFLQEDSSAPPTVTFSDGTADAIVQRYGGGISVSELIELLPKDRNADDVEEHVRLVDLVGITIVFDHFLSPQQLEMGWNINSEPAVVAEVSFTTSSVLSLDHIVTIIGMAPVFATYMAPFWNCGIEHTTMDKALRLDQVNADVFVSCGHEKAALVPAYTVNLMYLVQKSFRDYSKLDNSSHFIVGRDRKLEFDVPEKLASSPLFGMDGDAWAKPNHLQHQSPPPTPYGYLYTRDCAHLVDQVFAENGRNVQKYQAFIGDGAGDCHFHDSQETEPQVLCRLIFQDDELLLRDLDGVDHVNLSKCIDLAPLASMEQQSNFRQIEWFGVDTKFLVKRTRIRDNTSRQIRTFLLALSLLGSISYVCEYLVILKSVWKFTRNSIGASPSASSRGLRLRELLVFDPAAGALRRPSTVVLLYLGAVGALSNIFTLACHAEFETSDGKMAIYCSPSIPISSVTLLFTTLSSGFWIALITQQTRALGKRLRGQREPLWIRNWMLLHAVVLGIYAVSKSSTDLVLENVMLRSDPHLYAIAGGVVVSLFISLAFRAIHYSPRSHHKIFSEEREEAATALDPPGSATPRLTRFPSFSAHSATTMERDFLMRWTSNQLDNVVQQCATPTIALQLVWYCNLRLCYEYRERTSQQPSCRQQSRTASTLTIASGVQVSDFVAVHVAAGAWVHLESLAWSYDDRRGKLLLSTCVRERFATRVAPANG